MQRGWPNLRDERGFTLAELMVVVIIIGILAAIALPQYTRQADKAKTGRVIVELSAMQGILDLSFIEDNRYPKPQEIETEMDANGARWTGRVDPWGHPYYYVVDDAENPTSYTLISFGPDGTAGQDADDIVVSSGDDGPLTQRQVSLPAQTGLYAASTEE